MNRVILFGNLGRDPEVRSMNDGTKVCSLSLATTERWKDRATGEQKEKTEWHRIVAYGAVVDVFEKYCKKGSKLLVEGRLQTRKWVDQGGVEKYTTEIKLENFDFAGTVDRNETAGSEPTRRPAAAAAAKKTSTIDDDSVPW